MANYLDTVLNKPYWSSLYLDPTQLGFKQPVEQLYQWNPIEQQQTQQTFQQELLSTANQVKDTNPELYNKLLNLNNLYDSNFVGTANAIGNVYDAYNKTFNQNAQQLVDVNAKVGSDIAQRLWDLQTQVAQQYWPDWTLRKETDQYYKSLYQDLANQSSQTNIANQNDAISRWVDASVARNALAFNKNPQYEKYMQAKAQEVAQLDNLYKTYNQYLQNFLQQYWNTQDKYLIDVYKNIFNAREQIWQQLLNQQQSLLWTSLQDKLWQQAEARKFAYDKALTSLPYELQFAQQDKYANMQNQLLNNKNVIASWIAWPWWVVDWVVIPWLKQWDAYQKNIDGTITKWNTTPLSYNDIISKYGDSPAVRNYNAWNITDTAFWWRKVAWERFTRFDTPQQWFDALVAKIKNIQSWKSKVYSPNMNILQYISKYAPASDNNNVGAYAKSIANFIWVPVYTKIWDIDAKLLAAAHAKHEDGKSYRLLKDLWVI